MKVSDYPEFTGVPLATDFLYMDRSAQAAGARDFKFAASRLQSANAALTALAAQALVADVLPYGSGPATMSLTAFPAAGRTLVGAGTVAAQLFVLGLTNAAGLRVKGVSDGLVAHAGGGQAGATPMTADLNRFSVVATAADSGLLPTSAPGLQVTAINDTGNAMQVFGVGTDTINGSAAAVGVSLAAGKTAIYSCVVVGRWSGGALS